MKIYLVEINLNGCTTPLAAYEDYDDAKERAKKWNDVYKIQDPLMCRFATVVETELIPSTKKPIGD